MEIETEAWRQMIQRFPKPERLAKPLAETSPIDALHYDIAVRIFPSEGCFTGHTDLIFRSKADDLGKLILYLDEAAIDYVRDGEVDLAYSYADSTGELRIDFGNLHRPLKGETDTLTISYRAGVPEYGKRAGAMISPRITYFAWNLWYPFTGFGVERDRATVNIDITVPVTQTALSNGRLAEIVQNTDSTVTFRWMLDFPVPGPASLTAAPYVKTSAPYGDISVEVYTFPGDEGYAQEIADQVKDILDFYSSIFCRYPFSKLAIAEIDKAYGGGFGAQSLLCMYENFFRTGLSEERVKFLAHEAAHQWWGHMIGFEDLYAGGSWLNEGFAEYSALLYMEHKYGREVMLEYLRENGDKYLNTAFLSFLPYSEDKAITSPDVFESNLYSTIVYCKGSYIHHMLRYVVGDRAYFDIMETYAHELFGDLATVEEFQAICERVSDQDLEWFFDQWLRDTGVPCYSAQNFYAPGQGGCSTKVRISQGREIKTALEEVSYEKVFDMPVEITFQTKAGDVTRRMRVDASLREHLFDLESKPLSLELDRDNWLLKAEVDYQSPIRSLRAEARADSVILTWKALERGRIAGYNLYRREIAGEECQRLNPEPVSGLCYPDTTFRPDVFYSWVVTASDSLDPGYETFYSNPVSNYPWLAYDDGVVESFNRIVNGYGAVRFTPKFYPVKLEKVRLYIYETRMDILDLKSLKFGFIPFEVYVWDDDGPNGAPGTMLVDSVKVAPTESRDWYVVDLSPYNLTLSEGDFYVGWRDLGNGIKIGSDSSEPSSDKRSWFSEGITWEEYSGFVSMIRAQVAPVEETQVRGASDVILPEGFSLSQNFPNPFNPATVIRFDLPAEGKVTLKVYDVLGQEVRTLMEGRLKAGAHQVRWDGKNDPGNSVATGIYLVRMEWEGFTSTKKMLLLR